MFHGWPVFYCEKTFVELVCTGTASVFGSEKWSSVRTSGAGFEKWEIFSI
jgi:hypothetical protein